MDDNKQTPTSEPTQGNGDRDSEAVAGTNSVPESGEDLDGPVAGNGDR